MRILVILLLLMLSGCGFGKIYSKDGVTSGYFLGIGKLTETSIESSSPLKDIININGDSNE